MLSMVYLHDTLFYDYVYPEGKVGCQIWKRCKLLRFCEEITMKFKPINKWTNAEV